MNVFELELPMVFFASITPYFTDPLIWIGVILLIVFLLIRYFLKKDIITQLPLWLDGDRSRFVLKHGFVLGILLMVLGFGLKYQELSEAEESHVASLVKTELSNNLTAVEQMLQNIETLVASHQVVSEALRSGDSTIMNSLFPVISNPKAKNINFSKMVEDTFSDFKNSSLLKNKAAMTAFNASKDQINSIVYPHNQTLISMQDSERQQYVIKTQMWQDHKKVIVRIDDFDPQVFENGLDTMHLIREQYDRAFYESSNYFTETLNFLEKNTFIGNGSVFEILVKENKSWLSLLEAQADISEKVKGLKSQKML